MWLSHGHTGIYGDDGEMQCGECSKYGCWDYKNTPLDEVRAAYRAACMERAAKAFAAMNASPAPIPVSPDPRVEEIRKRFSVFTGQYLNGLDRLRAEYDIRYLLDRNAALETELDRLKEGMELGERRP